MTTISENAKRTIDGLLPESLVLFTEVTQQVVPSPLKLKKILDMAPITITDQTPMETVVDMFRKLGLRQTLVTHNGFVVTHIGINYLIFFLKFVLHLQKASRSNYKERHFALH